MTVFHTEEDSYNQTEPMPDFESIFDELFEKLKNVKNKIQQVKGEGVKGGGVKDEGVQNCDFLGSGKWIQKVLKI